MNRIITRALAVAATVGALLAGLAGTASAATTRPAPSWTVRTCTAFAHLEHHRTHRAVIVLERDAKHAPAWLASDTAFLLQAHGANAIYFADALAQERLDCSPNPGYGL
jgi:hypothetical protein